MTADSLPSTRALVCRTSGNRRARGTQTTAATSHASPIQPRRRTTRFASFIGAQRRWHTTTHSLHQVAIPALQPRVNLRECHRERRCTHVAMVVDDYGYAHGIDLHIRDQITHLRSVCLMERRVADALSPDPRSRETLAKERPPADAHERHGHPRVVAPASAPRG